MVEIVYLKPGEEPPVDGKWLLIECKRGIRGSKLIQHSSGMTIKISPEELDSTIDDCRRKASGTGMTKLYVREAANAQEPQRKTRGALRESLGAMTIDGLRTTLSSLQPGQCAGLHYDIYGDLFPPGEPDVNARAACYEFARSLGCRIENKPQEQTVWFVKDA